MLTHCTVVELSTVLHLITHCYIYSLSMYWCNIALGDKLQEVEEKDRRWSGEDMLHVLCTGSYIYPLTHSPSSHCTQLVVLRMHVSGVT